MLDLIITVFCIWLFFKALGLALRVTWGITKLIASVLFAIALPLLVVCLIFAGGLAMLLPLALLGIAFSLLKSAI